MLGLLHSKTIVVPYDREWANLFDQEERLIREAIGQFVVDIQHVGSTSIPGMDAKPVIDMGVALARFEDGEKCVEPLVRLGYLHRGLHTRLLRHRHFVRENPLSHSLHLLEPTNEEWANLVLFRDYLIAYPDVAEEYTLLRRSLAIRFGKEPVQYTRAKRPFVSGVLEKAKLDSGYRRPSSEL
jgi:GrpB-like predicted nucleotidyltransferase (UPF0157 family)